MKEGVTHLKDQLTSTASFSWVEKLNLKLLPVTLTACPCGPSLASGEDTFGICTVKIKKNICIDFEKNRLQGYQQIDKRSDFLKREKAEHLSSMVSELPSPLTLHPSGLQKLHVKQAVRSKMAMSNA